MACSIMGLSSLLKPSISYPNTNAAADYHPALRLEPRRAIAARTQSPKAPGVVESGDEESDLAKRIAGILPNAKLKLQIETDRMRRSVGVDFGFQRTGIAVTLCGLAPRPLSVVDLRGEKLIHGLLSVAEEHKADEFIVGLPRSWNIEENEQCFKTRSFAGRLAQWAAEKGIRVFLHDEYMSTSDALEFMTIRGSTKKTRRLQVDAYAAMVILQTYFHYEGRMAELVIPRRGVLQQKLCNEYYKRLARVSREEYNYSDDDEEQEELILI